MSPSVIRTQNLVKISLFAVLTYIGSLIQIPMYPAPITLQTFFVILSGLLLGPINGAISQGLYMVMGLFGLPVFSGGGGIGYVLHPSFGFIIGFIFLALISGLGSKKNTMLWIITGTLVLYLIGSTYIWFILNHISEVNTTFITTLTGMAIFLPGDAVKTIVAAMLVGKIKTRLNHHV